MEQTRGTSERKLLRDGSRIGVIGGGPAGSLFSYFLLRIADLSGLELAVDTFEPRQFSRSGPAGCNCCGGIISEWLVQAFALEGIHLPAEVVQRGIDSYTLHLDQGSIRINPANAERRIAALHRGGGPRDKNHAGCASFDAYLLGLAQQRGASWVQSRVEELRYVRDGIQAKTNDGKTRDYELIVVATGKQSHSLKMLAGLDLAYRAPVMSRTYICEIYLGNEEITRVLGNSMHLFLPDLPHVKFGALIPKGDYVTLCMLGSKITNRTVEAFVSSKEVRRCMPEGWLFPTNLCHCSPSLAIKGAVRPYADRILFVGDCSVSRLYKDGIGGAYRAAKAAAVAVVYEGVSESALRRHFWPALRAIARDNLFGKILFLVTTVIQKTSFMRRGLIRMVRWENTHPMGGARMSAVLWDTFTGSAPYRDVFLRTLHPGFWVRFALETLAGFFARPTEPRTKTDEQAGIRKAVS